MNLDVLIEKLQALKANFSPISLPGMEVWPEVKIWDEDSHRYDGMVRADGGMVAKDFDVQVVNGQVRIVPQ